LDDWKWSLDSTTSLLNHPPTVQKHSRSSGVKRAGGAEKGVAAGLPRHLHTAAIDIMAT
jgi:hypothetical protein